MFCELFLYIFVVCVVKMLRFLFDFDVFVVKISCVWINVVNYFSDLRRFIRD